MKGLNLMISVKTADFKETFTTIIPLRHCIVSPHIPNFRRDVVLMGFYHHDDVIQWSSVEALKRWTISYSLNKPFDVYLLLVLDCYNFDDAECEQMYLNDMCRTNTTYMFRECRGACFQVGILCLHV